MTAQRRQRADPFGIPVVVETVALVEAIVEAPVIRRNQGDHQPPHRVAGDETGALTRDDQELPAKKAIRTGIIDTVVSVTLSLAPVPSIVDEDAVRIGELPDSLQQHEPARGRAG